jgi:tetratricopeptide (TPR) repeat protein
MPQQTKTLAALLLLVTMAGALSPGFAQARPDRIRAWLKFIEAQRLADEGLERGDAPTIDLAIEALRETIRLDPGSSEPHLDLATLYLFGKPDPELAEKEAREAIRLAPESPDGYLILGRLAYLILRRQEEIGASPERTDRYDRAIAAYQKVTELDPRQTEGWLILQSLYETTRRFDDQINALEKFLAAPPIGPENFFVRQLINPPFTEDRAWFKLSLLYLLRGRSELALAAARRAYEADPQSDSYADNLFEVIGWVSSREEEVRILRRLFEGAGSPPIAIRYADALIRAGREEEALAILRDPVRFPDRGQMLAQASLRATALRRLNRRAEALTILREALAANRSDSQTEPRDLRLELAETLEELGRDPEAISQYEAIFAQHLRRGPEVNSFNLTVERLVRILRRSGRQARVKAILAQTRRVIDEHNPLLDRISMLTLTEEGQIEEALRVARAAARRHREDRSWLFTESSLLARLGRFPESIQVIESLIVGTPESTAEDCDLYLQLAGIYQQMGELEKSAELARRVLRLAASSGYLRDQLTSGKLLLGSILFHQGKTAESFATLREILQQDPVEATALNNLGYFMTEQGLQLGEARRLIERAVAIEPLNASFLDSLGWVLFKAGETDLARRMFARALFHAPRNATAREHLGDALHSLGRKVEARRAWEKALEDSDDPFQQERLRSRLR